MFWNRGDATFAEVAYAAAANRIEDGRALAVADFDQDGRLDLIMNNFNRPATLLMGRGPDRAWLQIQLEATSGARDAVGARAIVRTANGQQSRQVTIGGGYLSRSSVVLHFGLLDEDRVKSVEIHWPSGLVETYADVAARQRIRIREGDAPRSSASRVGGSR